MSLARDDRSLPVDAPHRFSFGGTEGNARLTSLTGMVLLILLFVEGMTLLSIHAMLPVHFFVGLWLIPPVLLKRASTLYRFTRYYMGNRAYRLVGPPPAILRLLGPVLVLSTIALFATGVGLMIAGPHSMRFLRQLHTLSFLVWFCVMTVHVLAHVLKALHLTQLDLVENRGRAAVGGALVRQSLVAGSLVFGLVVAVVALRADPGWSQWATRLHDG